jgi:hypothetical protein
MHAEENMSLISVSSDKATYALTSDQYDGLRQSLQNNEDVSSYRNQPPNAGSVTYDKIDFAWVYDGHQVLTVNIVADHNWEARVAGKEAIFEQIDERLIKPAIAVKYREVPEPASATEPVQAIEAEELKPDDAENQQ